MPFFDAHFHVTLKKQFANPDAQPPTGLAPINPWHTATRNDFLEGFRAISLAKCLLRPFVESSLVSQSSLSQLADHDYKLGMVALFAPDRGLMELILNNPQFIAIVQKGKFGNFLVKSRFEEMRDTDNPFEIVKRDLELIDLETPGRKLVKLRQGDVKPEDPLAIVFTVEGLHSLRSTMQPGDPQEVIKDILDNLDFLNTDNRVVSVNLTHIDNNNSIFANQAYAMDGFHEAGFVETNLRPVAKGLTRAGRDMATEPYKREVLPDLKHMSWQSRREFYQFRRDKGITAPLMCSHAGFTGCWFDNPLFHDSITDYIVQVGDDQHVSAGNHHKVVLSKPNPYLQSSGIGFNASSINLFNEDIRAILESGGMIGISLDQRILGYSDFDDRGNILSKNVIDIDGVKVVTDAEFISAQELPQLPQYRRPAPNVDKILRGVVTTDRMTGNSTDVPKWFHPRHFYLHIAHAIAVARIAGQLNNASGEDSALMMLTRTLCIGSDFDGMIDGLDCCPDVTKMGDFKKKFVKEFGRFLDEVKVPLPAGIRVPQIADRIFYENGREFVVRRVKELNRVRPLVA